MPIKRKAVSRSIVKRPSSAPEEGLLSKKWAAQADEGDGEIDGAVLKKPAMALLKRPAKAAKGNDAEDEEEEDEGAVLKKPATALLKRPAKAAKGNDADEEEEDEGAPDGEEDECEKRDNPAREARDAVKVVQQKRRLIMKLSSANETLYEKIKANKVLLRKAERELDQAKEIARKKSRKLGAIQGARMRKQMLAKKSRVKGQQEKHAAAVEIATKRYNKMRRLIGKVRGKTSDVEGSFKRARDSYEEAKKLCAKLQKEGEDVPEEGAKDYSAKFAWKPLGLRAAKARDVAKEMLLKAKQAWEKASAPNKKRMERLATLKAKVEEAKAKQEQVEVAMKELKKVEKAKKK